MAGYLHFLPEPLLDDIVHNRSIPIVGAGFSRNARIPGKLTMPLWDDLGKHFANKVTRDYPYTNALDSISSFCHRFNRPKLIEELRRALYIDKAKPGLAHLAFADLPFDQIITTNFDFLLEKSFDSRSHPYCPLIEEEQLSTSILDEGSIILKMHGDLNHPSHSCSPKKITILL